MEVDIAAFWYAQGERLLSSGSTTQAIDAFRKAVAGERENRKYAFALANALAAGNHDQEAMQTILRLREFDPENAEINLALARLAAKHDDLSETIHYYENAIYGRWAGTQVDQRRRQVRMELIRLLMAHQQRARAFSELLILDGDLPRTAEAHDQAGELFLQVGDAQHALNDFSEAIELDNHDASALAGAGEASFDLGDYIKARRYLEAAVLQLPESEHAKQLLSIVKIIQSTDPLAPTISLKEQQQRLLRIFTQSLQRLESCLAQPSKNQGTGSLEKLESEAVALRPKLQIQSLRRNPDLVRSGLRLAYRMEQATNDSCGEASGLDEAVILIARRHGAQQ
jgi:tetratricopeptide (TPR) repeat protein